MKSINSVDKIVFGSCAVIGGIGYVTNFIDLVDAGFCIATFYSVVKLTKPLEEYFETNQLVDLDGAYQEYKDNEFIRNV